MIASTFSRWNGLNPDTSHLCKQPKRLRPRYHSGRAYTHTDGMKPFST